MKIINADCLEYLKQMEDNSVDSIVTDPPYGLSFMGKKWDYDVPSVEIWKECLRVLKPGAYLLSFAGSRTYHRMAVNIEDAGFEIRDQIMWLYGSGFPKSLNIGKQVDKMNGKYNEDFTKFGNYVRECREKKGLSRNQVEEILGTNTALAWWEGRNYLGKFTVQLPDKKHYKQLKQLLSMDYRFDKLIDWQEAEREVIGKKESACFNSEEKDRHTIGASKSQEINITAPATPEAKEWEGWGTALKPAHEPIVVARKPLSEKNVALNVLKYGTGGINIDGCRVGSEVRVNPITMKPGRFETTSGGINEKIGENIAIGRFPANIILDEKAGEMLGEPSRFFYCAKASKSERNIGCEGMEEKKSGHGNLGNSDGFDRFDTYNKNNHPTVKPLKLMQYLVRLVTPKGGIVLDPFMGSGTTGMACVKEDMDFIGIEREEEYCEIARNRIRGDDLK